MPGHIKTETHTLTATFTDHGGIFRPPSKKSKEWRVIGTKDLLHSLHLIKDTSHEDHTKNNLQILIDQIENANTNV